MTQRRKKIEIEEENGTNNNNENVKQERLCAYKTTMMGKQKR